MNTNPKLKQIANRHALVEKKLKFVSVKPEDNSIGNIDVLQSFNCTLLLDQMANDFLLSLGEYGYVSKQPANLFCHLLRLNSDSGKRSATVSKQLAKNKEVSLLTISSTWQNDV